MHEINKICQLKSSRSPLEDDAEKNLKNFGKFSFEHFIRSPARKWSILRICGQFWTGQTLAWCPDSDLDIPFLVMTVHES